MQFSKGINFRVKILGVDGKEVLADFHPETLVEIMGASFALSKAFEVQNPMNMFAALGLADFVPRILTPCVAVSTNTCNGFCLPRFFGRILKSD